MKKLVSEAKRLFFPKNLMAKKLNIDFDVINKKFISNYNLFLDPNFKILETTNINEDFISQVKDQSKIIYKKNFQILDKIFFDTSFGAFSVRSCESGTRKNRSSFDIVILPKYINNLQITSSQISCNSGNNYQSNLSISNSVSKTVLRHFSVYDETTYKFFKFMIIALISVCVFSMIIINIEKKYPGSISNILYNPYFPIIIMIFMFFGFGVGIFYLLTKDLFLEPSMDVEDNFLDTKNNFNIHNLQDQFLSTLDINPAYNEIINLHNHSFMVYMNMSLYKNFEPVIFELSLNQQKENIIYRLVEARINYENLKNAMKLI